MIAASGGESGTIWQQQTPQPFRQDTVWPKDFAISDPFRSVHRHPAANHKQYAIKAGVLSSF